MTSKIMDCISELIGKISADDRELYRSIADFCISLPLKPQKQYKKNQMAVDFKNAANNSTIARIGIDENGAAFLKLRFYASDDYSEAFGNSIRSEIAAFKGIWVGCTHCGKERGERKKKCHTRYTVKMPDGKTCVRCGFEPVKIVGISAEILPEIKRLITAQNTFFNEGREKDEYIPLEP